MTHAQQLFRNYTQLAKSGIVSLVLISVLGGYFIGHSFETSLDYRKLISTLVGVLFIAAASSAWNQLQEREIDSKMPRTSNRPLLTGRISVPQATLFVTLAMSSGLFILYSISFELLVMGSLAIFSYNILYTLWWKKKMSFAAVPGAIPGALPILMGYVAARENVWAIGGWYLFAILFFWQMPHFWCLALKYSGDYQKGGIPTLPVTHGPGITLFQISVWTVCYIILAMSAPLFLGVGAIYLGIAGVMSFFVLKELWKFSQAKDPTQYWIRFFLWVNFSLIAYVFGAALDLWSIYTIPYFTQ